MSLNPDAKLLTQRFMEVGGGNPRDGFCGKRRQAVEVGQRGGNEKRRRMESEHNNLSEEATDIAKQVEDLVLLKEKIVEDFQNPSKASTKRELSFGSNKILLLIGLGTIAASLFSESFGSYYAAIGIALSLGGFFWPSAEERKAAFDPTGEPPSCH